MKSNRSRRQNSGKHTNFIVPKRKSYVCGHCGETVDGGRYNNHCPHCLWSKHLDRDVPGDRASKCQALMKPIGVTQKKGQWRIVHQCTGCETHTITNSAPEDNFDLIIELSQTPLLR